MYLKRFWAGMVLVLVIVLHFASIFIAYADWGQGSQRNMIQSSALWLRLRLCQLKIFSDTWAFNLHCSNFCKKSSNLDSKCWNFFIQFCSHSFHPINRFEFWRNFLKVTKSQKLFSISNDLHKNEQNSVHKLVLWKRKCWRIQLIFFIF